ncbi:chitinase [Andreprevotia lacus DSM 23236]|uniref:chitinase n=1 Tax=Andreprevotia lacus DSM 23236 TaxID=1121001 RepID=A0A1W1XVP6_9NEIS|nr:chitinase [Andreprevotia lacus DSM 23236]
MMQFNRFALAALPAALLAVSAYAAYPAWQEGNTYTAGTYVSYNGHDYQALVTHTAYVGAGWTPSSTPTLWKDLGVSSGSTPTATPAPTAAPTATPVPVTNAPTATPKPTAAPTTAPTATPAPSSSCYQVWSASTSYNGGAQVTYNGRNYTAKWWTQGNVPSSSTGDGQPWTDNGPCNGGTPTATPVPVTSTPTATPKPTATPVPVTSTPTATPVPGTPTATPKPTATPIPTTGVPTATPTPSAGGKELGSYFAQWGVYGRAFEVADFVSNGSAAKMTYVNYAFGNIYQKNGGYECGAGIDKLEQGATNPNAADAGTGGDAWADYGRTPARLVDPSKPYTWDSPLAGNFGELKALKGKFPNLKVFISLGGWTWSKWFSAASATDALRKQLVSSCLDIYIKGNLPSYSGRGGAGSLAGVFDGVDIDWEFPGGGGQPYNTFSAADKQNFTLLMKEFRTQLNALGAANGNKHYYLTAALSAGKDKIDNTEPVNYAQYFDFVNLMTYDFHGGWEYTSTSYMDAAGENHANAAAKTDFHSNLYVDPNGPNYLDPKTGQRGVASYYNIDDAVKNLVAAGLPASKISLGVPFYGRGWTGVPNVNNGLYQQATTPAHGTYENGIEDFKVLKNAAGTIYVHPVTKQSWKFDGSTFWSYDTPEVIQTKIDYTKANGLGGMFSWSLDGDDSTATLMTALSKIRQ